MKKLLVLLLTIVGAAAIGTVVLFYNADKIDAPTDIKITVGTVEIEPSGVSWKVPVINDFEIFGTKIKIPQKIKNQWILNKGVAIDRTITEIKPEGTTLEIKTSYPSETVITSREGKEVYRGETDHVSFAQKGKYDGHIAIQIPQGVEGKGYGTVEYDFFIEINPEIKIVFDRDNIKQGDLVRVDVENLLKGDTLEIESEFKISDILREDQNAHFYIPINYLKPAQRYDLNVIVNGESFLNRYEVKEAEFTVIRFNVDEDITSATVNSAAANQEYREKIHPLYYTRDEQQYWSQAFVKPVQEREITSTFGQKRYVNNSLERHSGIDYAAPQGTPVFAPAEGNVEFAGFLQLSGNTVVIEHGLGLKSYYFHMKDVFTTTGTMVKTGDKIGEVGSTGYSTGPHLHFQVSIENQPINPEFLYSFKQ